MLNSIYCATVILGIAVASMQAMAAPPAQRTLNSTACARPGYVFIPCQKPKSMDQQLTDREGQEASDQLAKLPIDKLQAICEHSPICAAYTTEGGLFTVSRHAGRIGALESMHGCQPEQSINSNPKCIGTYVFDGQMVQKQKPVGSPPPSRTTSPSVPSLPALFPWPPPETATAGGGGGGGGGVAAATLVTDSLRPQYVRASAADGGAGKVGKEQCQLC